MAINPCIFLQSAFSQGLGVADINQLPPDFVNLKLY